MVRPYEGLAEMTTGLIHNPQEDIIGIAPTQLIDKPLKTVGIQIRPV